MASRGDPTVAFVFVGIFVAVVVFFKILTIIQNKIENTAKKLSDDLFSQRQAELTKAIEAKRLLAARELEQKTAILRKERQYLDLARSAFEQGFLHGRQWLANFIAEGDKALDEQRSSHLANKSRPALKAAEEVALARAERRHFKERVKFLEYQLKSYKEYFPFLEEYEEIILDEAIPLSSSNENIAALENADSVLLFVPKSEYEKLSPSVRNQLALDRYLASSLSRAAIGRFYERYLGYLYEKDGWKVEYHGIVEGYEDLGRDLICEKGNKTLIVQAKCWSSEKTIHEKYIFQLFGTTQLYLMD